MEYLLYAAALFLVGVSAVGLAFFTDNFELIKDWFIERITKNN